MKRIINYMFLCLLIINLQAEEDPLPSWNEGETKTSILNYVQKVVKSGSDDFIPLDKRIATFDQDGTLWVEQPLYTQLFYAIDRILSLSKNHPEWKSQEPFKSILEGDFSHLDQISESQIEEIVAIAFSGMTTEVFLKDVSDWLKIAKHPRFERPFTDLVYQPMLELIQFLRRNEFKIYIVSGGGQDFMRAYADAIYGIPVENIIGTSEHVKYEYREGSPVLIKQPKIIFLNDHQGKPEGINLIIGKRPAAAFGNSTGDQQMLEWTQGGSGKNYELLVHHDDAVREYSYGPNSKIGTFSVALMDEAKKNGWTVVSMKNDWKVIFPWQLPLQKKD